MLNNDHSSKLYWHCSYPWLVDPATLPNNRKGVEATFRRTEKKLAKEPEWKASNTDQVHKMVVRKAAIKLIKEELLTWSDPV